MLIDALVAREVECIPHELEQGVLYVSRGHVVTQHLCPCGCEARVVLPISAGGWTLTMQDGRPTLSPSVRLLAGCRSHYSISNGKVVSA